MDQRGSALTAVVIDASTIGLILLEEDVGTAVNWLEAQILDADLVLAAHWPLEIASLLVKATRHRRLELQDREARLAYLERIVATGRLQPPAATRVIVDLALATGLTAYDAVYLELAIRLDATLATNDDALIAAARARRVPVLTTRP